MTARPTPGASDVWGAALNAWLDETFATKAAATHLTDTAAHEGELVRVNEGPLSLKDSRVNAVLDGVADDTAKLATAVGLLPTEGGEIFFPPGAMKTTAMLEVANRLNVRLVGAGKRAIRIIPTSALGANPTLRFTDCRDCAVEHMEVQGGGVATSAIESRRSAASPTYNARNLRLVHVRLGANSSNNVQVGFRTTAASGADTNNDFHYFENVEANNASVAAFSFEHYNSLCHTFVHPVIGDCPIAVRSTSAGGGAFEMFGGFIEGCTDVIFDVVGAPGHSIVIVGTGSESNGRLLRVGAVVADIFMVGVGFNGALSDNVTLIDSASSGQVVLDGGRIAPGGTNVSFNFSDALGRVVVRNVRININTVTYAGELVWADNFPTNAPVFTASGGSAVLHRQGRFANNAESEGNAHILKSGARAWSSRIVGQTVDNFVVTADGVLEFGSGSATRDTNLYRIGTDRLRTDDKFLANAGLGVGNSVAATTPGSVTRKIEVFDASGTSLGFLPVYGSIT